MSTWDTNYKDKPAGGDAPSTLDNEQRTNRESIEVRMENEHDTFEDATAGLASKDWRHKEGSARAYYQSLAPTHQPGDNGAILGASDDGRIWVDSDDETMQVWDGSAFKDVAARGVPTYGEVGTIVIAASNAWSRATEYLPGTTVAGNTLYVDNTTGSSSGYPLSAIGSTIIYVDSGAWQTLSLTGTWRLLCRVLQATNGAPTRYTIGMLQRIS